MIVEPSENEIPVKDMELQKRGDHLVFYLRLMDGATLTLPISEKVAQELGRALLEATQRIILPGVH